MGVPAGVGWVGIASAGDAARARAAGLSFREGRAGGWVEVDTDRADGLAGASGDAGLAWRSDPPEAYWRAVARTWGVVGETRMRADATRVAGGGGAARPGLPDSDDVERRLGALADAGLGTIVDVGTSVEGRPIVGLRVAGPRAPDGTSRSVRVLGGHHGDEGASVEVALAAAERVAREGLPAGLEVWFVPLVNPDGAAAGTRRNARGVDLNRNYGVAWSRSEAGAGAGPFSEPETRAIRALGRARDWLGGLSLHGGAVNLGWVWNWSTSVRPPEETLLVQRAEAYAADCTAPGFWITNGADWYVTHGDTTDWSYGALGQSADYTLEVSEVKSPPADTIPTYTGWHLDAIDAWIREVPSAAVQVVDTTTGLGIPARVGGADIGTGWTGPDGAWARWLDAPADALVVSADGYAPAPLRGPVTALVPVSLLDAPVAPRLAGRADGPVRLVIEGVPADAPLRLVLPGEPDLTVPPDGDGWTVDPAQLAAGAWTLVTAEGSVPRGFLVAEQDATVRLDDAFTEGDRVVLVGEGFGRGTEVQALVGSARAPVALTTVSWASERVEVLWPEGASDNGGLDLLVWSRGITLAAAAVGPEGAVLPDDPPSNADTGGVAADDVALGGSELRAAGVCGPGDTRGGGAVPGGLALVGALAALAGRRRAGLRDVRAPSR